MSHLLDRRLCAPWVLALTVGCGVSDETAVDGETTGRGSQDDTGGDLEESESSGSNSDGESDTGTSSGNDEDEIPPLPLPPSDPPVDVPEGTLFSQDVSCGDYELTAFDVFLPDSDAATPLLVYVHGGGFTGGDKGALYLGDQQGDIAEVLEAGIAFANFNYRLLDPVDTEGVYKPLGDSRRCLQFVRYHADSLNIDPDRIAMYGGSAGAGTALWLGTHDDMADPASSDPVETMSTRLSAVGISGSQSTYDTLRWQDDVFADYELTFDDILAIVTEQRLLSFYGVSSLEQLDDPEIVAYRDDVDMLDLLDGSDPPVAIYSRGTVQPPVDTGVLFHHPSHSLAVMEAAQTAGVTVQAYIPAFGLDDPSPTQLEFLIEQLML